jgi:hypothetical protein
MKGLGAQQKRQLLLEHPQAGTANAPGGGECIVAALCCGPWASRAPDGAVVGKIATQSSKPGDRRTANPCA